MKMKMILLVLGLAMVQDQTLAASKHHLVETKHKHYLVETKNKTQVGKVTGGGEERPLGEQLPDGFEFKDYANETWNLTGAIELHRLVLQDYDQLKKRKNEITRKIIDSTCEVDDGFYKEVTPLFLACWFGADKAALLLLSKGADPNKAAKDEERVTTPLYQAIDGSIELVKSLTKVVKSLLASGADPNKGQRSTYEDGDVTVKTPLYKAAWEGYTDVVRSLLESKADPNEGARFTYKDNGKVTVETPLYVATEYGNTEIVKILLASGARQDLDTDESPLEAAKNTDEDEDYREEKREIVKLLEAAQSG